LAAVCRAVDLHGDLLRAAVATPGNDWRLGANEAPPAIISVYTGEQLEQVIEELTGELHDGPLSRMPSKLTLGASTLPPLPREASDRNRTSPFAFTGNKFEFRAVGSSQSCARPGFILNAIIADTLEWIAVELEKLISKGLKPDLALHGLCSEILKKHKKAIFNGNGYSDEWRKEAEKRGLWNLRTAPEAIQQFASKKNTEIFERCGILSPRETQAWQNILFENFVKTVAIEAECLHTMAQSYIVPAALEYRAKVKNSIDESDKLQQKLFQDVNKLIHDLLAALGELKEAKTKAASMHDEEKLFEQSTLYRTEVWNAMLKVRAATDSLETIVDDNLWPFPKYSEMLLMK